MQEKRFKAGGRRLKEPLIKLAFAVTTLNAKRLWHAARVGALRACPGKRVMEGPQPQLGLLYLSWLLSHGSRATRQPRAVCRNRFAVTLFNDPATAQHFIATIEHSRLTRGDGSLWLIELHANAAITQRLDYRRLSLMPIAHPYRCSYWFGGRVKRNPVYSGSGELGA